MPNHSYAKSLKSQLCQITKILNHKLQERLGFFFCGLAGARPEDKGIFSGGGRQKNGPDFLVWHFEKLVFFSKNIRISSQFHL